jgi:DNA uptake protein ComE-like DNA-binding protein
MTISDIGKLISTATKNIHSNQSLTENEHRLASKIAHLISKTGRNWLPIYVYQHDIHDYEVVGSSLVLEAVKLANLREIYCIQIDDSEATKEQILEYQKIIDSYIKQKDLVETLQDQSLSNNDQQTNNLKQEEKDVLYINNESVETLRDKLIKIKSIGKQTVNKIISYRPFQSESDFCDRAELNKIQIQKLKQEYILDFSIANELLSFNAELN